METVSLTASPPHFPPIGHVCLPLSLMLLQVKEMDDEDVSYASLGEPLYRVETGNYEYR